LSFSESRNSKQLYHICTTVTAIYPKTHLTQPVKPEQIFSVQKTCTLVVSAQIEPGPIKKGMILVD